MSQLDTGLGWSAKDDWLLQAGNYELAKIGDYTGLCGPLNVGTTQSQVWQLGQNMGTSSDEYSDILTKFTSYNTNGKVYCAAESADHGGYWFISISPNTTVYGIRFRSNGRVYVDMGRVDLNLVYDRADGTRFYYRYWGANWGTTDPAVPVYPNIATACNAFVFSGATFTKTNPGFAVACLVRWKTPNETILESPILISSDTDYTDMSTTGTGISLAKLNIMYQGRKFFMSFYDQPYLGTGQTTLPVIDRSYSDAPTFTLEQLFKYIAKDVYSNIQVITAPDPYQDGEGSAEGGGDGEEDESDEIPFTDAPVSGIAYSGFLTIFTPNLSQLQSLANYMWSDFFDVDTWKKLFANPMDAILGLHIIPCSPGYSGNKEVKVGGMGTGVSMDYTTIRYHEVSMGTCTVPKKWGSYLDYNPYTKVSIFLPYIGFRDLDTDDVMDRTLALQYIVDILTGACVAELRCGTDVLYSWEGNCANPVPITSNSWSSAIGSAVSIAAAIATTALTHGASAPMIAGTVASVGANSMNLKPSVSRSGSLGGSGGFIAKQTPYIIRTVPNLVIPADQNKFIGYPSFVTTSLGSLVGYNEISSIHLEGIPATGNELSEIETLLKGGVIF